MLLFQLQEIIPSERGWADGIIKVENALVANNTLHYLLFMCCGTSCDGPENELIKKDT